MIKSYKGPYKYNKEDVGELDPDIIGVYYCGYLKQKDGKSKLVILYIGRATSDDGIRGRLLQHLNDKNNKWPKVSHFGYEACSTSKEAIAHEASEIKKYEPSYNDQGK